jgi:hypothetical protein
MDHCHKLVGAETNWPQHSRAGRQDPVRQWPSSGKPWRAQRSSVTAPEMHPWGMFKGCRLARMSDGHLLRSLGPVKGGNGMKHHEVVIDFSRRGMVELFRRLINRKRPPAA